MLSNLLWILSVVFTLPYCTANFPSVSSVSCFYVYFNLLFFLLLNCFITFLVLFKNSDVLS